MRVRGFFALLVVAAAAVASHAQFAGNTPLGTLHNLGQFKPPAGAKAAIVVFEDLGCPACGHAHPIEQQIAAQYHVPIMRYDFPLAGHIWTGAGAIDARYIQTRINPNLADQFRSDVFRAQLKITSVDDINQYFQNWLRQHGQNPPFVIDPSGVLNNAVQVDANIGHNIGIYYTPTMLVVTADRQQVVSGGDATGYVDQLGQIVQGALAEASRATHK